MAEHAARDSAASSGGALGETVAETGGGIPDEAVAEGELAPGELGAGADQAVEALERAGWTGAAKRDDDEVEAEAEVEAHPS